MVFGTHSPVHLGNSIVLILLFYYFPKDIDNCGEGFTGPLLCGLGVNALIFPKNDCYLKSSHLAEVGDIWPVDYIRHMESLGLALTNSH